MRGNSIVTLTSILSRRGRGSKKGNAGSHTKLKSILMAKPQPFSIVGQRVQRVEGYDKVTGESKYIADIHLPGMLTGKILRSPYPHARILRIDTRRAEKLRGVR